VVLIIACPYFPRYFFAPDGANATEGRKKNTEGKFVQAKIEISQKAKGFLKVLRHSRGV
jgi:hypothetical protein